MPQSSFSFDSPFHLNLFYCIHYVIILILICIARLYFAEHLPAEFLYVGVGVWVYRSQVSGFVPPGD